MKKTLRSFGIGKLALKFWHTPVGRIRDSLRNGGPWEERRTEQGRREMEAAAHILPTLPASPGSPRELHLLTGRRYWYQTAFCLQSFALQGRCDLAPVILDDGSLDSGQTDVLRRLFPRTMIVRHEESVARLEAGLPRHQFPSLRSLGDVNPLLQKLTAPHVGRTGWKLLIDSDLIFFRQPHLLLDWLAGPTMPLRATDVQNSYGYPLSVLNALAGQPVPERVNTGLLGLHSEMIDWERMEHWCGTLIEQHGPHYYQEQALVALLLASRPHIAAPPADYVILPEPPEALDCRAVMHHYVAHSKRWYFQQNWRRVLAVNVPQ